tara:strand:- start:53 stop:286 length:234 start_codon:yes stop_codon:yes gene_type:complete
MKILLSGILSALLTLLNACGADSEETNLTQESEPSQQGILTNQQQQTLDAAKGVEQTLLNSAADREKELEARLQRSR